MSENRLVAAVTEYLLTCGHFVYRTNNFTRYSVKRETFFSLPKYTPRGMPDIQGMLKNGRYIGVECKWGKGRQSPDQKIFQQNVEKHNGIYILAYTIDDVIQRLGLLSKDR